MFGWWEEEGDGEDEDSVEGDGEDGVAGGGRGGQDNQRVQVWLSVLF